MATAVLKEKITALTARVESLEGILQGVTNEVLTDSIAAVAGLTNLQLTGALADVNALCTQASALTIQVNSLASALGGTTLGGVIPLGLSLLIPGLPAALPSYSCRSAASKPRLVVRPPGCRPRGGGTRIG